MKHPTDAIDEFNPVVLITSLSILVAMIVVIIGWPDTTTATLSNLNETIIANGSWFYLWLVFLSFVFLLYVILGPWGRITLGSSDEEPEYSYLEYLAMMFTAGLSSGGLEYWGPVEPLVQYQTPPPFFGSGLTEWERITGGLQYAIFHYGTSAWSVYLVFGVLISYFVYRKDMQVRPAVILAPFLGEDNIDGWIGKTVDTLSVVVAVSGITVSFGLGVNQILSGFSYNWGFQTGGVGVTVLILLVTALFLISVLLGIKKGIRRLADLNVVLLVLLTVAFLIFGPLSFLLNIGTEAIQGYITDFVGMSLFFSPDAVGWLSSWTVFFWAWWLTFAPMIGVFMARISRGRTLRQVVVAGIVGSFALTVPWYTATGGSSLWLQTTGQADLLGVYSEFGLAGVSFALFDRILPFADVFSVVLLLLVLSFLITTLDSATLSFSIIATGGEKSPTAFNRVIWGLILSALTIALSLAGGISILRSFTVVVGLPAAGLCTIALFGAVVQLERDFPVLVGERKYAGKTIISKLNTVLPNQETDTQESDD